MRGSIVLFIVVASVGLVAHVRSADAPLPFEARSLVEVDTLTALPAAIQLAISGYDGIADRREALNATDVVNPRLRMRRFVVAGASPCCFLVAYEQGGRGYSVQVKGYTHSDSGWVEVRHWTLWKPPASLKELVERIEAVGNGV